MSDRRQISVSRRGLDLLTEQAVQRDNVNTPYRLEIIHPFLDLEAFLVTRNRVMSRIEVANGRTKDTFTLSELHINPQLEREYLAVTAVVRLVAEMIRTNYDTGKLIQTINIVALAHRGEVFDIEPRINLSQKALAAASFLSRYRPLGKPIQVAYHHHKRDARGQPVATALGLGYSDTTTRETASIIRFVIKAVDQ